MLAVWRHDAHERVLPAQPVVQPVSRVGSMRWGFGVGTSLAKPKEDEEPVVRAVSYKVLVGCPAATALPKGVQDTLVDMYFFRHVTSMYADPIGGGVSKS